MHSTKAVYNSGQLSSMQSSIQRTLKVKQASHGTSPMCILSPSDRQRRTGLQAVARVCTPTLSTQENPCAQASGVDS